MSQARRATAPKVVDLHGSRAASGARPASAKRRLLYEDVIALVERLVAEHNLAPGDLLPTQAELAQMAGVSSITVRRALEELERAGRIRRHQGVGTFLAGPKIVSEPGRSGTLLGTLTAEHRKPRLGSRVIAVDRCAPSHQLAAALQLEQGGQVWRVQRLRLVDGRPAVLETAAIPVDLAPGLDRFSAQLSSSLYELLEQEYQLTDDHEEQYLEVGAAGTDERRHLNLVNNAQVVRLRGLSVTAGGMPFDCFEQVYPASEFVFYISGGVEKRLLSIPGAGSWGMGFASYGGQGGSRGRTRAKRPGSTRGIE
jgi:GntR family transcriptional regulator